jgi:hypothetical protein
MEAFALWLSQQKNLDLLLMLAQPTFLLLSIFFIKIAHFLLLFKLISQPKTLNRCKGAFFV